MVMSWGIFSQRQNRWYEALQCQRKFKSLAAKKIEYEISEDNFILGFKG
jgi:hypothetical protein